MDYTAEGPQRFLKAYRGYLQADALAQYEGLYGDELVLHVCCWAHARRKLAAAADAKDERAEVALGLILQLSTIERDLPPCLPPSDDPLAIEQPQRREEHRRDVRQRRAGPILVELKRWLDEQRPNALPMSPLGQAIGYSLNNLSERTLRAVALGRNN
jgi:hypothetical protein